MLFRILADTVVVIHFVWILFLLFGAFLGIRNRAVRIFHLAGLAFALLIQVSGLYCPLTDLEIWLRSKHHPALGYGGSFIVHYLEKVIYVDLPPAVIVFLTVLLCAANGWFYLRKRRRN